MTDEELLNEQKREFVSLNLELRRLRAQGITDKAKEDRLKQLFKLIAAGNRAQDLKNLPKRPPTQYGAPTFKNPQKPAGKSAKPDKEKQD